MEVLHAAPTPSSFIPLEQHQSQTPESFYSGPPILHLLSEKCKLVISETDLRRSPALNGLRRRSTEAGNANGVATQAAAGGGDETGADEAKQVLIDGVDVWVTSERLILFSPSAAAGLAVRYPSISLHAIQRLQLPSSTGSAPAAEQSPVQGIYMQLASENAGNNEGDDDDMHEDSVSFTIVPEVRPRDEIHTETEGPEQETKEEQQETPTQALFAALSACSNLHPDPAAMQEEGDGDDEQRLGGSVLFQHGLIAPGDSSGGLPPAMPGSGGWITAENVHEYFDEEGNWIGPEGDGEGEGQALGPGAGTVRTRDEAEGEGEAGEDDETKWRRTG